MIATASFPADPLRQADDADRVQDRDRCIDRRKVHPTCSPGAAISARLSEDLRWPRLCLAEQGHQICIGAESSDTGPYPDRSAEVPVLLAVAEALRFPADLDDRSSWFAAEDVFG